MRPQVQLLDLGGKDAQLRLRAANLLGLLIRHASSISAALAAAGVPAPRARRPRAVAVPRRSAGGGALESPAVVTPVRTPSAGVCEGLAAAIRQQEDPQLQRRAAAALGELLFYADSQVTP